MKKLIIAVLTMAALSCASVQSGKGASLLPLSAGWYQYDFERTFKGIEDEYNFAVNYGMKMIQEITYKYTGVVSRFEGGVLYDPVSNLELSIDKAGAISCAGNYSISGKMEKDGSFFWSGLKEEHGRLNNIFVKGTLSPLPAEIRGGREFNGVYHMTDSGTGREMLVNISEGFYTWHFIDGQDTSFTPWPTLIEPDGSFGFSMEITTVMEIEGVSSVNFSTGFSVQGKVIPGQSISQEEYTISTGGIAEARNGTPQLYAGTVIRSGEFPNESIPGNIETLIKDGKDRVRAEPKPNKVNYPAWYIKTPNKPSYIYAVGEKTFDIKETAIAMAEAAAAARIAERLRATVETETLVIENENGVRAEDLIISEALQRLNYRVAEMVYNEETRTAFVLVELKVE